MNKPWAEAAEQNKGVIFDAIEPYLHGAALEIGSGTGQHAVYFASRKDDLDWQPSDLAPNLPGIERWIVESGLGNIRPPLTLDVNGAWPEREFDLVFSANTFHIMSEDEVARCIACVGACLRAGGAFALYGPFNYDGSYTSESNASFDAMLRARNPASGIRDFDWLDRLATAAGMILREDIAMPANNRTLIWQKRT